jgi:hypothetical protein
MPESKIAQQEYALARAELAVEDARNALAVAMEHRDNVAQALYRALDEREEAEAEK